MEERIKALEDTVSLLKFKIDLLKENSNTSNILFQYDISYEQYKKIMDLMNAYRTRIDNQEEVSSLLFEQSIYDITGNQGDYHFCEFIAKAFMEDGRWEEVFPAIYGKFNKYKLYMERRLKGED
jgi:FtsZ-binding cell division protein ZapB